MSGQPAHEGGELLVELVGYRLAVFVSPCNEPKPLHPDQLDSRFLDRATMDERNRIVPAITV